MSESEDLTILEAAEICGMSEAAIRGRIRTGRISAHKLGNMWYIRRADLPSPNELADLGRDRITCAEAAELTGYAHEYIARLCAVGKIRGERAGEKWLVDVASLREYIQGRRKPRPSPPPAEPLIKNDEISIRAAAEILGLSEVGVLHRIQAGKLAARREGRRWYIQRADLESVESGEIKTPDSNEILWIDPGKDWLTSQEAADCIGCARESISRLCRAGKIECEREGAEWLVETHSLREYVQGRQSRYGPPHRLEKIRHRGISISQEVYDALSALQQEGESKTDVLARILNIVH